jgi:hypothetical protein
MENIKKKREKLELWMSKNGYTVKVKQDIWWMWVLKYILFFTPGFMTRYISTIGKTVYFPQELLEDDWNFVLVMPHELRHAKDFEKYTFVGMGLGYLFPQILSLFAFLAFYHLGFLAFLVFLFPIPSYGRAFFEARAFGVTLLTRRILWSGETPSIREDIPPYIMKAFTGSAYYWMWPFTESVERWLREQEVEQQDDPWVKEMLDCLR